MASLIKKLNITAGEFFILLGLTLLYALVEGIGVGLLFPIMQYIDKGQEVFSDPGAGRYMAIIADTLRFLHLPVNFATLLLLAYVPIALKQSVNYYKMLYTVKAQQRSVARCRSELFDALLNADMSYHKSNSHGQMLSALTLEASRAGEAVWSVIQALTNSILLVMMLAISLYFWPTLTTIEVVFLAPTWLIIRNQLSKGEAHGSELTTHNDGIQKFFDERLSLLRLVKLMNTQAAEKVNAKKAIDNVFNAIMNIRREYQKVSFITDPVSSLSLFFVVYVAVEMLGMTLAQLSLFTVILLKTLPYAQSVNHFRSSLSGQISALRNVDKITAEARANARIKGGDKKFEGLRESIKFENVTFKYTEDGAEVLRGVSLAIPKGKMIAVVGPSGAGKSTFLDLIPRLIGCDSGRILIDGVDIKDFDLSTLRRRIGYISQDSLLFDNTISKNLLYGIHGASDAEMREASAKAHSLEFITGFADGFNTHVGYKGSRLSGGQRQRLAIARMLLQKPDILLMDEPTSALDSDSEAFIQDSMKELHGKVTMIVVAHRFSTVVHADEIVVMEDGMITEQGAHSELYSLNGTYRRMFDRQSFSKSTGVSQ